MEKVSKQDIMTIPLGDTCHFEMDTYKACLSARAYCYQLARSENFVARVSINGNRVSITRC